ncbi:MAG TPA: pentapeptide repeat-containing protein, partial [Ktedonobacterales bacterium]|nr:pentapeptide repeat-containing protein [Ktedonobacterales bacterium]
MSDPNNSDTLKWGESFDLLSVARKQELCARLDAWTQEVNLSEQVGPFAGERLNGLEVRWLASCMMVGRDNNPSLVTQIVGTSRPTTRLIFTDQTLPLSMADLHGADLDEADLATADLRMANLSRANLGRANMYFAHLNEADLSDANLCGANLMGADLSETTLVRADLSVTNLGGANLSGADLHSANLGMAQLVRTDLSRANLTGCNVYGIAAWDIQLDEATQTNLQITPHGESVIAVEDLEVAQFLYLMLNNTKLGSVIDNITSKVILILGRFTEPRKQILDVLREALRAHGYVSVLFDFDGPKNQNTTETITLLARMARFIIADLTDPRSIPHELAMIAPQIPVPIQPL